MEYPDDRCFAFRHAVGGQPGCRYPELRLETIWRRPGFGGQRYHHQRRDASGDVDYTAPTLSGALPTFGASAAVMTDVTVDVSQPTFTGNKYAVNSSFAGTEVENMKVTGVTYVKQAVDKATFTGTKATLGFSGDEVDVSVAGSYDKANKGTLAFTGDDISLNVGDITVPAQTIEVTPVTE